MNFVPFAPFLPPGTSARAQDLGDALSRFIDDYRRQHPGTRDEDVRGALHLAARRSGGTRTTLLLLLTLGLGLMVLLGLLALFWMRA